MLAARNVVADEAITVHTFGDSIVGCARYNPYGLQARSRHEASEVRRAFLAAL